MGTGFPPSDDGGKGKEHTHVPPTRGAMRDTSLFLLSVFQISAFPPYATASALSRDAATLRIPPFPRSHETRLRSASHKIESD